MSAFGRWLNRPRKRSNSPPSKQVLSDFLNRSAQEQPVHPTERVTQYQSHDSQQIPSDSFHSFSLPQSSNTTQKSNAQDRVNSAPMLITSSYYNTVYPFDDDDDDEDYELVANPKDVQGIYSTSIPLTPSSATLDPHHYEINSNNNKNKQQPQGQYVPQQVIPPISTFGPTDPPLGMSSLDTQEDVLKDFNALDYYPREATWNPNSASQKQQQKQQQSKRRPLLSSSLPNQRRPTPFADQANSDSDDNYDAGNEFSAGADPGTMEDHHQQIQTKREKADYNAKFQKLKTEIKRLEKKHREHERLHQSMLDTQQQLEYLLISKSYESSQKNCCHRHSYSGSMLLPSIGVDSNNNNNEQHSYGYSSSSKDHPQKTPYWYPSYDLEYYPPPSNTNQTPSSLPSNSSTSHFYHGYSMEGYEYFDHPANNRHTAAVVSRSTAAASNSRSIPKAIPFINPVYDKRHSSSSSSDYPYSYRYAQYHHQQQPLLSSSSSSLYTSTTANAAVADEENDSRLQRQSYYGSYQYDQGRFQ